MTGKASSVSKTGGSKAGVPDALDAMPLRYGDDPYVWACWLYYEDGKTQGDIAEIMGISRATVNSYLADARSRGIVNISLEPSRLSSLSIAQELKRHFGLHDCLVVPSDDGTRPLIDRLGTAGAQAIARPRIATAFSWSSRRPWSTRVPFDARKTNSAIPKARIARRNSQPAASCQAGSVKR